MVSVRSKRNVRGKRLYTCNPAGLTDYEIRDLNDEINKLLREKSHFERQIIALGGANYRRARTNMLDEDGREVPGTRGYKSVLLYLTDGASH